MQFERGSLLAVAVSSELLLLLAAAAAPPPQSTLDESEAGEVRVACGVERGNAGADVCGPAAGSRSISAAGCRLADA